MVFVSEKIDGQSENERSCESVRVEKNAAPVLDEFQFWWFENSIIEIGNPALIALISNLPKWNWSLFDQLFASHPLLEPFWNLTLVEYLHLHDMNHRTGSNRVDLIQIEILVFQKLFVRWKNVKLGSADGGQNYPPTRAILQFPARFGDRILRTTSS